jgi:S1-C subfamily serine protease
MSENITSKKKNRKLKAMKIVVFLVLIFVIAGASSVVTERYFFPWLATRDWFRDQDFFKQAMENVTVINKTEQTTVNESRDISSYTDKSASSVVEVVANPNSAKSTDVIASKKQSTSGIIVTADGLVASFGQNFFADKNTEYKVFTNDGKSYDAKIVILDPYTNISLLKMDGGQNLSVAEFIAPEDIKTGMKTAVIGRSGFNSEISLRSGITSEWAKSYSLAGPIASSEKLQGVLFSDLSTDNQWDDTLVGGAAVDQNGDVIGIIGNRKEDVGTRYFVVPVNHLQYVIDQYLASEKITRAVLGVYYMELSKETAYQMGSIYDHGALIYSPSAQQGLAVITGSPADLAGIRMGDIVLSVDGNDISPDQNLAYLISQHKPGDEVTIKIARDGKEMDAKVVLQ